MVFSKQPEFSILSCYCCRVRYSHVNPDNFPKNLSCDHTYCADCCLTELLDTSTNFIKCLRGCETLTYVDNGNVQSLETNSQLIRSLKDVFADTISLRQEFFDPIPEVSSEQEAEQETEQKTKKETSQADKLRKALEDANWNSCCIREIQESDKKTEKELQKCSEADFLAKRFEVAAYFDKHMKFLEENKKEVMNKLWEQRKSIVTKEQASEKKLHDSIKIAKEHAIRVQNLMKLSDSELIQQADDVNELKNCTCHMKDATTNRQLVTTELFIDLPEYNCSSPNMKRVNVNSVLEINCEDFSPNHCLSGEMKKWLQKNLLFIKVKKQPYEFQYSPNSMKFFYKHNNLIHRFKFIHHDIGESRMTFTTAFKYVVRFTTIQAVNEMVYTIQLEDDTRTFTTIEEAFKHLTNALM